MLNDKQLNRAVDQMLTTMRKRPSKLGRQNIKTVLMAYCPQTYAQACSILIDVISGWADTQLYVYKRYPHAVVTTTGILSF